MATLTGKKIANTYLQMLQVGSGNVGLSASLQTIQDGSGANSPLQLSSSTLNINGTIQFNGVTLTATASTINTMANLTGVTGIVAVSASNVYGRTLTAGAGISISNATGTEGNPTFSLNTSGVSAGSYGPVSQFQVNTYGQVVSASIPTSVSIATVRSADFIGGTLALDSAASITGTLHVVGGTAIDGVLSVGAAFKAVGNISGASGTFTNNVSAAAYYGDGSNLTNLPTAPTSVSAYTVNDLYVLNRASFAAAVSGTSAVFTGIVSASSYAGSGAALTGVSAVFAASATNASFAISATNATNAVSATFAASATNATNAVNVIGGIVSATSGTFSGIVSATSFYGSGANLTGISAAAATSVVTFTVNQLTVVSSAAFTGPVSGTSAIFTGIVSASSYAGSGAALTGVSAVFAASATNASFAISATNATNAVNLIGGVVSATSGTFSGIVSATSYAGSGAALTGVSAVFAASATNASFAISATNATNAINVIGGVVSATTGTFSSTVSATGAITDSIGDVRKIPANAQGGAYTLVLTDAGKHIAISTGGVTVPASIFSAGDVVSIYNNSASNQTITQGATVTMYLVGTATTGNRTLAQRGVVTILCVASNTFVISGGGLT